MKWAFTDFNLNTVRYCSNFVTCIVSSSVLKFVNYTILCIVNYLILSFSANYCTIIAFNCSFRGFMIVEITVFIFSIFQAHINTYYYLIILNIVQNYVHKILKFKFKCRKLQNSRKSITRNRNDARGL